MEPIDAMIAQEEREHLTGAIKRLPETERLVFRMCDVENFSEEDAGACIAMSRPSIRRALKRARTLLRRHLL